MDGPGSADGQQRKGSDQEQNSAIFRLLGQDSGYGGAFWLGQSREPCTYKAARVEIFAWSLRKMSKKDLLAQHVAIIERLHSDFACTGWVSGNWRLYA